MSSIGRIRPATLADFDGVHAIHGHPEIAATLTGRVIPRETFRVLFDDMLATRDLHVYEREREIAGFFRLSRHPGRTQCTAYLGTVAIRPALRGTGVAQDMIALAIERAGHLGFEAMELLVDGSNQRAIAFYRAMGFEIVARRPRQTEGTASVDEEWTMRLALRSTDPAPPDPPRG